MSGSREQTSNGDRLVIKHAAIVSPGFTLADGAVVVAGGRIQAVFPAAQLPPQSGTTVIDAQGHYLVPGFIDLQINGGFGHDFTAVPDAIWPVAAGLPRFGVTGFLPTIITAPPAAIMQAQQVLARRSAGFAGAEPLGLHLEGPFLNPAQKGAHNPNYLRRPAPASVAKWSPAAGVRLVTLAPELPGALALIQMLSQQGVVVSAGHSQATFAAAAAGFDAGIRYGTHLFNAMGPLHHRQPGLPGALLADDRVTVGLIADGIHVHPSLVNVVWRALGNGRLTLVSDAMAALGMPPGQYPLGESVVTVDAASARLPDGSLAGSIVALDTAIRNLMAFTGCSLAEALPAVTTTPVRLLQLDQSKGKIAPGYDADLVILTSELAVHMTFVSGRIVFARDTHFLAPEKVDHA